MERLTSYKSDCKREMICRYEDCDTCEEYCPHLNEDNCPCLQEILNKLAEYEDLEEQGKLLKLPCVVGDTVWHISERIEKYGRKNVTVSFIDKGTVDNITLGDMMIPQITVCNNENEWITFDSVEDFGKTVFLTKSAAEQVLKNEVQS